jgi:hypothetical protein
MTCDAFISYSNRDKAAADAACATLEASGIRCWIAPRDVTPGMEWGQAIIQAINGCRVLILIFSASANDSPQIRREVERAVSKGLPVIPLRIEDIAPNGSLEYFIGTVHWLDALTPPLEAHLRRLVETVKSLLQINPTPPGIATPAAKEAPVTPPAAPLRARFAPASAAVAIVAILAVAGLAWEFFAAGAPLKVNFNTAPSTPDVQIATAPVSLPAGAPQAGSVDPELVGVFVRSAVIDGYDWRFTETLSAEGAFGLTITKEESGTYQAANGAYQVVNDKGVHRSGRYRAIDATTIRLTSNEGTADFKPAQPGPPLNLANPVMLGTWTATGVLQGGFNWTVTIRNTPDGRYTTRSTTEDHGSYAAANGQWSAMSVVTGQRAQGTYKKLDARTVSSTDASGRYVWQMQ